MIASFLPALALGAAVMTGLWALSVPRADASLVDLWWGPGFFAGACLVWFGAGAALEPRALLVLGLLIVWSARLLALMLGRRRRHRGEDPRYAAVRRAWQPGFWWKSLFLVFLLQALLQWIIGMSAFAAIAATPAPLGALALAGSALALAGIALEAVADAQLDAHKRREGAGSVCASGLRAHVRYPNYSGEMAFWVGLWLIAAEAGAGWTLISPVLLVLLLTRVSGAPMLEERLSNGRAGYDAWRATTPAFVPRLRRRRAATEAERTR